VPAVSSAFAGFQDMPLVFATVELIEAEGRRLRFAVECRDDKDLIGRGFHDRAVIDSAKFKALLVTKAERQV
jgi:fluoroacetyl-CoA thioesterase